MPAPLTADDFPAFPEARIRLGRLLFYDRILSGNRNIACATCHMGRLGGSDGLSLGIGEGGRGVGPDRNAGRGTSRVHARVPRNAPGLWNLGHPSVSAMFWDGRVEIADTYRNRFDTPAEEFLPEGLTSPLAAQALFPLASRTEMAGDPGENEVAGAIQDRIDKGWPILVDRLRAIPEYAQLFAAAYPERVARPADITVTQIANALAAYQATAFQSLDSPFDAYLRDGTPLPPAAERGRGLFYGKAGCDTCHSGPLLTDQRYHALGLPAFGPGRTRPHDPMPRDVGRMGASDRLADADRFRTPSLRNVALTAPYGHNGAWPTLAGMIRQHLTPEAAREAWRPEMAILPEAPWIARRDFVIRQDRREMARQARAVEIDLPALTQPEIADLVAFLNALTGKQARDTPPAPPARAPSGLAVDH